MTSLLSDPRLSGPRFLSRALETDERERREVVFVDGRLPDYDRLIGSIGTGAEVVVLGRGDGLRQIAGHLAGSRDIDAIHILSHGEPGRLQLGDRWLDGAGVEADAALLAEIGYALADGGDILVYGCRVAMDDHGKAFVQALASATDANVAASRNLTGSAVLGGDWVLDEVVGALNSRTQVLQADYPHVLATLQAGDMVVLGISQPDQTITFATLVDIPAGTVLKITDKGWNQATGAFTTFNTGDGVVTWTVSSAVSAGDVFTLSIAGSDSNPPTNMTNVTAGQNITTNISLSGYTVDNVILPNGEQVFIYEGDENNPSFIFGLNASRNVNLDGTFWQTAITAQGAESMIPDGVGSQNGLTNGVNAVGILTNPGATDESPVVQAGLQQFDNVFYNGPTTQTDKAGWLARITDAANWSGDDTGAGATSIGVSSGSSISMADDPAPVIDGVPALLNFTEDGQAPLDLSGMTISDSNLGGGNILVEIEASSGTFARAATDLDLSITGHGTSTIGIIGSLADVHTYLSEPTNILYTPEADLNGVGAATIMVTATDQENPGEGSTISTPIAIDIAAVNDAPTATNLTQNKTATEGGSAVALDDIVVTDVDTGDTITATLTLSNPGAGTLSTGTYGSATSTYNAGTGVWMVQGSVADVNAALAAVALTPSAGYDEDFTITTRIRDAAGTGPADGTISVTVTPVNDAPVVTTSGGNTAAMEGSSVVVDGGMTLSDPDNTTMASAMVSITGNFQPGEDVLAFVNDGATMGNISASYDAGTGVLTLTSAGATATLAQWQAALRSVTYENSSQDPATADRTISVVVNDGTDDSAAAAKTVTVTAVNDAPTITAPGTIPAAEGATTAVTGISFSDVDAGSATVSVTLNVSSGTLSAISGAGVTAGGTSLELTLTGTISDINAFVAASNVSYTAVIGGPADVDLTVTINDGGNTGSGGAQEDTTTVSLSVAAGAPVVTDGNISISGATGTGGTFKIGDTVTAIWDNSAAGDDNVDITSVTFDFSQFGGGAAVSATNSADIWTATHVLTAGAIDASSLNVSVTATNGAGNATTTADATNATVDTVVPLVASVAVPPDGTYVKDDALTFKVVLDDVVDVAGGSPRLAIDLNTGGRVYANYVSGSGTDTLTFDLVVSAGQVDDDGIEIAGLDANGATITDAAGNVADLTLQSVADTSGILFDAPAPGGGGGDDDDDDGGVTPITPITPKAGNVIVAAPSGDGTPVTVNGGVGIDEVHIAGSVILGEGLENAVIGGAGDYTVQGNDLDNVIYGNVGNTTIFASAGRDFIDGGYGANTVVFDGPSSGFSVRIVNGVAEVTNLATGDVTTIANVATLQFSDGDQPLFATGQAMVSGFYEAFLGRELDRAGFEYWMGESAGGQGPFEMVWHFINSPEFLERTESLTSTELVEWLYDEFLGREQDTAGQAYWIDAIENGMSFGEVAANFVFSQEVGIRIDELLDRNDWLNIA